jgi:hypothetical protein
MTPCNGQMSLSATACKVEHGHFHSGRARVHDRGDVKL